MEMPPDLVFGRVRGQLDGRVACSRDRLACGLGGALGDGTAGRGRRGLSRGIEFSDFDVVE